MIEPHLSAVSAKQNVQPFLRQRTFAHNDTRSEDVGSESLVTSTHTFERHTRTQPISHIMKGVISLI